MSNVFQCMMDLNDNPASALCAPLRLQDTDSDKPTLTPSYSSDLDKTAASLIFRKRKKNLQKDPQSIDWRGWTLADMLEVVCPPEGIQEEPQLPLSGLTNGFLIINCSGVILTIICLIIIQVHDVILLGTDFLVIMMMIKTVANDDDVMMKMN